MVDLLGPAGAPNAVTTRPSDARVFSTADTFFKGCSAPDVDDGTEIQADWLNGIMAQVRRAIRGMGITVNNADDDMLLKAIQSSGTRYAVDTGLTNAIVIANAHPIAAYVEGTPFLIKIAHDVTGATTANIDAVGAKNVIHPDGTALVRGDWPQAGIGLVVYDGTNLQLLTVFYSQQAQQYGQCYLSLSAGNLLLKPRNGRFIFVNGAFRPIPSAGVTLGPSGFVDGTPYYIYAKWAAGALALDKSTIGYATDSATGAAVKSDDPTWTLVGMALTAVGAFYDAGSAGVGVGVLSWFNRRRKHAYAVLTLNTSTSSPSFVEISTALRVPFLCWGDEFTGFITQGSFMSDTAGTSTHAAVGVDGTTPEDAGAVSTQQNVSTAGGYCCISGRAIAEGAHYSTLLGSIGAGTVTFYAAGGLGSRPRNAVEVLG